MKQALLDTSAIYFTLYEVLEFLEDQEDVVDGPDGVPQANRAMQLAQSVRAVMGEDPVREPMDVPFGGDSGGGLTQCDMHEDESY